jgi:chemotaxis protein MotB
MPTSDLPAGQAPFELDPDEQDGLGKGTKARDSVVQRHERRVARSRKHWRFEISEESEEWVISYMDMVTLMMCAFVVIAALLDLQSTHTNQPQSNLPRGTPPPSVATSTVQIVPPPLAVTVAGEQGRPDEDQSAGGQGGTEAGGPAAGTQAGALDNGAGAGQGNGGTGAAAGQGGTAQATASIAPAPSPEEVAANAKFEAAWRQAIADQGLSERVSVSAQGRSVIIQIQDEILFATGSADLGNLGHDVIRKLAPILAKTDGQIRVEGHTDNVPIDNDRFASNWELSAGRATSVVRALIDAGIQAPRLRATGYADTRPVQTNDTDAGRARNRRVSLIVER